MKALIVAAVLGVFAWVEATTGGIYLTQNNHPQFYFETFNFIGLFVLSHVARSIK